MADLIVPMENRQIVCLIHRFLSRRLYVKPHVPYLQIGLHFSCSSLFMSSVSFRSQSLSPLSQVVDDSFRRIKKTRFCITFLSGRQCWLRLQKCTANEVRVNALRCRSRVPFSWIQEDVRVQLLRKRRLKEYQKTKITAIKVTALSKSFEHDPVN